MDCDAEGADTLPKLANAIGTSTVLRHPNGFDANMQMKYFTPATKLVMVDEAAESADAADPRFGVTAIMHDANSLTRRMRTVW
jgi:hypothetical protein